MGEIPRGDHRRIRDADTGHEFRTQGIGLGIACWRDTVGLGIGRGVGFPYARAVAQRGFFLGLDRTAPLCAFPPICHTRFRQFGLRFGFAPLLVEPWIIAVVLIVWMKRETRQDRAEIPMLSLPSYEPL